MMDMGAHVVHAFCTLFGRAEAVWAEITNRSGAYPDVDDFGVAHIRFRNGVFATMEASWVQTGGIGGLEVTGRDRAIWNTETGYRIGGPDHPATPLTLADARPDGVERLLAAARGKLTPEELAVDREATFGAVMVMAAAYRSAAAGGVWTDVR